MKLNCNSKNEQKIFIENFYKNNMWLWSIIFILCVLYLWHLGMYPLINPDEGRYAEIPREMLATGDFITPHLNGIEYFEKPILQYWVNAFSMYIFGETEFAVRLFPALCGLGGIFFTGFLGKKMFNRQTGILASIILATSFLYFVIASINILDMAVSFFIVVALVSFYQFSISDKSKWLYLSYIAMALGVLTKGLIGVVLTGIIIVAYILCTKRFNLLIKSISLIGIILFLVITVPWFYLVCKANSDFFYFFFIQEHFLRYLTKMHDRYQPFYFFVLFIILGIFPWTGFLCFSIKKLFSPKNLWAQLQKSTARNQYIFLALWFSIIFVFYSLSDSKLIPYIVPCLPPLAIIIAARLLNVKNMVDNMNKALIINLVIALVIVLAFFITALRADFITTNEFILFVSPLILVVIVSTVYNLYSWRKHKDILKIITVCVFSSILFAFSLQPIISIVAEHRSSRETAQVINDLKEPDTLIICYSEYIQDLPFYTKSRVAIYDYMGELEFGANHPSGQGWFLDERDFLEAWNNNPNVIVVAPIDKKERLLKHLNIDKTAVLYREIDDYIIIKR